MLKANNTDIVNLHDNSYVYRPPSKSVSEKREMEKACARLFATEDGKKVLAHLQEITFCRALGPSTADEHLRYIEGQRALVATMLRLIDRGKTPA